MLYPLCALPMLSLELCERPAVTDAAGEIVSEPADQAGDEPLVRSWLRRALLQHSCLPQSWLRRFLLRRSFVRRSLSRRSLSRRSVQRLIFLFLMVLFLRTFIGEASVVPTGSMEGTILVGDHLFM